MADGGAHAQMIPGRFDLHPRTAGANQEIAYARGILVGLGPDRIPVEASRSGRVDLRAADRPAMGGAPRDRGRQAAAYRRAQFRFDPQPADQPPARHRVTRQFFIDVRRPAARPVGRGMIMIGHEQDQRGRGIALRHRRQHPQRFGNRRAPPAKRTRHGQRDQPLLRQYVEIGAGKFGAAVILFRIGGQQPGQPIELVGRHRPFGRLRLHGNCLGRHDISLSWEWRR